MGVLTDKLNALLNYANDTTGQNDENLGDAIATLVDGFGQGGEGGGDSTRHIEFSFSKNCTNFNEVSNELINVIPSGDVAVFIMIRGYSDSTIYPENCFLYGAIRKNDGVRISGLVSRYKGGATIAGAANALDYAIFSSPAYSSYTSPDDVYDIYIIDKSMGGGGKGGGGGDLSQLTTVEYYEVVTTSAFTNVKELYDFAVGDRSVSGDCYIIEVVNDGLWFNSILAVYGIGTEGSAYRYRNGVVSRVTIAIGYDADVRIGTTLRVIHSHIDM